MHCIQVSWHSEEKAHSGEEKSAEKIRVLETTLRQALPLNHHYCLTILDRDSCRGPGAQDPGT